MEVPFKMILKAFSDLASLDEFVCESKVQQKKQLFFAKP